MIGNLGDLCCSQWKVEMYVCCNLRLLSSLRFHDVCVSSDVIDKQSALLHQTLEIHREDCCR